MYLPKLDEAMKQQQILIEEVKKMKKDVEYFPALFRLIKLISNIISKSGEKRENQTKNR